MEVTACFVIILIALVLLCIPTRDLMLFQFVGDDVYAPLSEEQVGMLLAGNRRPMSMAKRNLKANRRLAKIFHIPWRFYHLIAPKPVYTWEEMESIALKNGLANDGKSAASFVTMLIHKEFEVFSGLDGTRCVSFERRSARNVVFFKARIHRYMHSDLG
jgi:hypothetical protein